MFEKNHLAELRPHHRKWLGSWDFFNKGKQHVPTYLLDICNQSLFNNRNITRDDRMSHFEVFIKSDIKIIGDILNPKTTVFLKLEDIPKKITDNRNLVSYTTLYYMLYHRDRKT